MDKNQILDQLKKINYPGFNRDIVSFGMVKDVVIDQSTITIILAISCLLYTSPSPRDS